MTFMIKSFYQNSVQEKPLASIISKTKNAQNDVTEKYVFRTQQGKKGCQLESGLLDISYI